VRELDTRVAAVIRVDAVWLAVDALDMRSGTESALARVVNVFGSARPHHAYLFSNRRANRMKVLVHDGVGIWLAARRLHSGKFAWPKDVTGTLTLTREQHDALVLGFRANGAQSFHRCHCKGSARRDDVCFLERCSRTRCSAPRTRPKTLQLGRLPLPDSARAPPSRVNHALSWQGTGQSLIDSYAAVAEASCVRRGSRNMPCLPATRWAGRAKRRRLPDVHFADGGSIHGE
jgi:transposase